MDVAMPNILLMSFSLSDCAGLNSTPWQSYLQGKHPFWQQSSRAQLFFRILCYSYEEGPLTTGTPDGEGVHDLT